MSEWASEVVRVSAGLVRGVSRDGVRRFLGVPYAAPPAGELRFKAPATHASWDGEQDATERGPNAPQVTRNRPGLDLVPVVGDGWRQGEDYLALNIWAPKSSSDVAAPVMVFIHGGAFVGGSPDASAYDGSAFARDGVVCVNVGYRVGVEGFAVLDGAPTNLGLRDMLAALRWVREEIAAFGGDPDAVTVFGESSGAMAIGDLVASPLARGLFRRAILQSGHGGMVRSRAVAEKVSAALAAHLGVPATSAAFAGRSEADCIAALDAVSQPTALLDLREANGTDRGFGASRFLPVHGDDIIPIPPMEALAAGIGADIDLLVGANSEEMNLYLTPAGLDQQADAAAVTAILAASIPDAPEILEDYGLGSEGVSPGQALGRALTDLMFRQPVRDFAAAHTGAAHVYEFSWRSPALGGRLGACHALELPFVFDTLDTCVGPNGLVGEEPPRDLASRIHGLWVAFAKGEPLPWAAYNAETRQVFDVCTGRTIVETETPLVAGRTRRPGMV